MYEITLSRESHDRIQLLARAWQLSADAVVDRLIAEFQQGATPEAPGADSEVGIHAVYKGVRTEATFHAATGRVVVRTGPLAGQSFPSPSGAAMALVARANPEIRPERNGWNFWMVTKTGRTLRSIRRPR